MLGVVTVREVEALVSMCLWDFIDKVTRQLLTTT